MPVSGAKVLAFPSARERKADGAAERLAADAAARAQALDVQKSWIVEAPAGSGKTGLLVQRYLKLLAAPTVEAPEDVLAITFTRKATAELRERIVGQMRAADANTPAAEGLKGFEAETRELAEAVLARDARAGWRLLERPERLNVRTIDSVCADIAGTLPLLSGSGAARRPVDDAEPLYRQAAERVMLELGGRDARLHAALRTVLLHRDGNVRDCTALLARMLAQREQWGELVPLGAELEDDVLEGEVRPRLERALQEIVCAGLSRAVRAMPEDALRALGWLAARMGHAPGYGGARSPLAVCAGREDIPGAKAEELEHWQALVHLLLKPSDGDWRAGFARNHLQFEIEKADVPLLKEIVEGLKHDERLREALGDVRLLPPVRYPEEQWVVAKALFRLLVRALAELKVLFAERGECDFAEMSIAAKQALRAEGGAAELAAAGGGGLRHLLVDEMQDTSSGQYELIELLTRSWDGAGQTLFLVGDPKQSIYLFRQARVERFLRTMREGRLGEIRLGALRLTANFRSQAELVRGFNEDFEAVFPSPEEAAGQDRQAVDVPFVRAEATRAATDAELHWHTAVARDDDDALAGEERLTAAERRARAEARMFREVVVAWRAKPLPEGRTRPWRIAVLARARGHFAAVLAEFKREDAAGRTIPFRALDIEALGEQAEVLDLLALTRALLHPADRTAWLAALHAPWCGLGLADLHAVAGGDEGSSAVEALPRVAAGRAERMSAEGQKLFARAWPVLMTALDERGRGSTAALVERAWRSLGGDAPLGERQRENAELFLRVLREVEEPGGRVDIARLKAGVEKLYAQPGPMVPEAVELLTIHGAKGLEWDVVCVPGLERKASSTQPELLNWLEMDGSGDNAGAVVLAPIWGKGEKPDALYKWLGEVRKRREAAERKRVFYVAATRAREELHLFAAATVKKGTGELVAASGSLLQAAWGAAERRFAADGAAVAPANVAGMPVLVPADLEDGGGLALAASAGVEPIGAGAPPRIERLPLSFAPRERFARAAEERMPYTPGAELRRAAAFARPEGSFALRAFGNVVHRFLQALSGRLADGAVATEDLAAELQGWGPRLTAALRAEGLPPGQVDSMAARALRALRDTLADPVGAWVLGPHLRAATEQTLGTAGAELRVDRTFVAGPEPGTAGETHLWVVDFKTTAPGALSAEAFEAAERAKYGPQLRRYAESLAEGDADRPVVMALYYPLAQRMVRWE